MMRNSANPASEDDGDVRDGVGSSPLLISFMPFVLLVLLYIVFPAYGLQNGGNANGGSVIVSMVFVFFALLWGSLGIYLVSESDTYGKAIGVLLFFTIPSSFVVVMAPWFKP
jgi:uncharacterized BrkB/YihY/UPF0761 family membrane protein